ncbi:MAG: hypothetical protein LAQ69_12700 [Acidobacteriia bacterium]|nr:hypothetical protein [Terriglobia bacterium]
MKGRRRVWLLAGLCGLGLLPATAGATQIEVRWQELSPLILGHKVTLVLPGAVTISGDAVAVRDDSLMVDIRKTSDAKAFPKGSTAIPRASVTTLQMTETKGVGGRVLGVVVGALIGMVGGGEIVAHGRQGEAAGVSTFLAVAVAGSVGGYYAGKAVDRHTTIIRVVQ